MRFHIFTFGCQMNAADSDWLARSLEGLGWRQAEQHRVDPQGGRLGVRWADMPANDGAGKAVAEEQRDGGAPNGNSHPNTVVSLAAPPCCRSGET